MDTVRCSGSRPGGGPGLAGLRAHPGGGFEMQAEASAEQTRITRRIAALEASLRLEIAPLKCDARWVITRVSRVLFPRESAVAAGDRARGGFQTR